MAFEADTTQDILKKCFNPSLSTLQVTLKGGSAISLGAVRIVGTASALIQGTTTYGLEVDVLRLPANVSPNISAMQDDISVIRVDTSQMQQNMSTVQQDISVMQDHTSLIRVYASTVASAMVSETKSRIRIADTWTSGVHGVRSAVSTAAIRIAHGTSSTALKRGFLCRAHTNNTTTIYVGFTGVTGETTASTCGQPLLANQSFLIEANNSYSPYAIANAAAQKIHYFGI